MLLLLSLLLSILCVCLYGLPWWMSLQGFLMTKSYLFHVFVNLLCHSDPYSWWVSSHLTICIRKCGCLQWWWCLCLYSIIFSLHVLYVSNIGQMLFRVVTPSCYSYWLIIYNTHIYLIYIVCLISATMAGTFLAFQFSFFCCDNIFL